MNRSQLPKNSQYDPVLLHSRREALVILVMFGVCLVWSVTLCYVKGYRQPASGQIVTILGMPSWVFWGVLFPWLIADLFTFWFCFHFMKDDPLGEAKDESEQGCEVAESENRCAGGNQDG